MVEVSLPSGAQLRIDEAPFEDALELHNVILEELRQVDFSVQQEIASLMKSAICAVIPSKRVRSAIEKCMARAMYNGARIDSDLWKSGKGKREDYIPACVAIAAENIRPFAKSLYAEFSSIAAKLSGFPA